MSQPPVSQIPGPPVRRPFIGPLPPPQTGLDLLFGRLWPSRQVPGNPRLVIAAGVVGLAAAVTLPESAGLGLFMIMAAGMGVVAVARRAAFGLEERVTGGLILVLLAMMLVRDAAWIVALSLVAAYFVGSAVLSRATTVTGMVASILSVPMAWLRGLPWLKSSLARRSTSRRTVSIVRTVFISGALLLIFGALFASADALFAQWLSAVTPSITLNDLPFRIIVFGCATACVLGAVYVAVNPPAIERFALGTPRPVRRFEWAVPVASVMGVFVVFLAAQLTALFGGHAYVQQTTGLTYAEYVHQGFGQMVAATVIVLLVVGITARRAPRRTSSDRLLLRILLGGLCFLALVVVASALYRIQLYEQAYGFTRLRLTVTVFELWLGLVLLLVATAGVRLRGAWVPKVAAFAGAIMIAVLGIASPDAMIAERNMERFAQTQQIDWRYLNSLSADAVPTLDRLPEPYRSCVLAGQATPDHDWFDWNFGRARAEKILSAHPVGETTDCHELISR